LLGCSSSIRFETLVRRAEDRIDLLLPVCAAAGSSSVRCTTHAISGNDRIPATPRKSFDEEVALPFQSWLAGHVEDRYTEFLKGVRSKARNRPGPSLPGRTLSGWPASSDRSATSRSASCRPALDPEPSFIRSNRPLKRCRPMCVRVNRECGYRRTNESSRTPR